MSKLYISIAGMIGAGKSTLCKALAEELELPAYYESVNENVYLEDFYKDQAKYGFPLQIHLLTGRFKQQQQVIWNFQGGVQDRTIYEDTVFARCLRDTGKMEQRDYQTYVDLFEIMSKFMARPNLIVFLDVTPEESLARIKERERGIESTIPIEYLQALRHAYEEFITEISKNIPVIKVDWSKFSTAQDMASMIKRTWEEMSNVKTVVMQQD